MLEYFHFFTVQGRHGAARAAKNDYGPWTKHVNIVKTVNTVWRFLENSEIFEIPKHFEIQEFFEIPKF